MRNVSALAVALMCAPQIASAQNRDSDSHFERRLAAGQRVHARNINGDIVVTPSSSGRVEIVGVRRGSGALAFKSVSGGVKLDLPRGLDADLSMSSVSGQLDSEFQMTLGGRTSRRRIEARIGRGGRDLDVTTVSGDVRLRVNKD